MATLKSIMASDVTDVFIDTDEFAEASASFALYTFSNGGYTKTTPDVIVFEDGLEGSREVQGDGIYPDRASGNSHRESIVVSFNTSDVANLQYGQGKYADMCKYDGRIYVAMRVTGRDDGMTDVLFAHTDKKYSSFPEVV